MKVDDQVASDALNRYPRASQRADCSQATIDTFPLILLHYPTEFMRWLRKAVLLRLAALFGTFNVNMYTVFVLSTQAIRRDVKIDINLLGWGFC